MNLVTEPGRNDPEPPPVNLNYSPRRKVRGGPRQKSRLARDSLVPPDGDFGYAGDVDPLAPHSEETMP